jgi:photosystem II stability/assembly factor-like uncharacterized protein
MVNIQMKRLSLLILALVFAAASCNSLLFGGTGNMGVFKSDDSGDNFHEVNKVDKKNNLNSTSVNAIAFAPGNTQIVYMGASAGLYKTENAGDSWNLILTNISVADVAVDPTDTGTIYAVGVSGGHGKIVKTTDNGGSWHDEYTEPTTENPVRTLAVNPLNHFDIWAGLTLGEIIHSVDGGNTWQLVTDLHDFVYRLRFGPNNNVYALTQVNGFFESRDGGKTLTNLTGALTNGIVNLNEDFSAVSKFLDLAFDLKQKSVIYLSTNAGLVRTVDDGANWSFIKMPLRNSELRTSAVAVNPFDSNNIYATVGSTLFKSINGGVTWETKLLSTGQEVRQILIDPTSSNVIYLGLGVHK